MTAGTYFGAPFDLFGPAPGDIDPEDLAWALGRLPRFNGMTHDDPLSVAQHSVLVSYLVPTRYSLHGLLHDAAEAYTGDLVAPLKRRVGGNYASVEAVLEAAIAKRFGIEWTAEARAAVKEADRLVLSAEVRDLRPNFAQDATLADCSKVPRIDPWPWERAVEEFRTRLDCLWEGDAA